MEKEDLIFQNTKNEELDVYGEQVRSVLSNPPSRLYSIGNTIVVVFLVILIALSWFIKLPEIVTSEFEITTQESTLKYVCQTSGFLSKLNYNNDDYVEKGELVAIIDNGLSYSKFKQLEDYINQFENEWETNTGFNFLSKVEEPNLQRLISELETNYLEWKKFSEFEEFKSEVVMLESQLAYQRNLQSNLNSELKLVEEHIEVLRNNYSRQQKLYEKGVIALVELERSNLELIEKKREFETSKVNRARNQIMISSLKQQVEQIKRNRSLKSNNFKTNILELIKIINSELNEWKNTHILISKNTGFISYIDRWQKDQYLQAGTELFVISPKEATYVCFGRLSMFNSGKVKIGQKVLIKLHAYPEKEYGIIEGNVTNISKVQIGDDYLVEFNFSNNTTSNFGKRLELKHGQKGVAEIVTNDLRLIERIFYELRAVFD